MLLKRLVFLGFSMFFAGNVLALQDNDEAIDEPNDSNGEIRYVVDDLFTYMHAGPGRNFRILGSVQAGTRLTLLQVSEDQSYIEIIDDKQRTGWVDIKDITANRSIREILPEVRGQLDLANEDLRDANIKIDALNQQIADLASHNEQLQQRFNTLSETYDLTRQQLDNQDQSSEKEWFTRGGVVAFGGIILGILLTYLPKKRKRNDNWM
ncbi:TIGR04211 family SH3 domain-containing protein [Alteromonadaceae bacterium BrNp21-10]|nr:TIGR04211 family SH3 domain-containing protein [Alteromonadaceae bacterium BrNp21-10]